MKTEETKKWCGNCKNVFSRDFDDGATCDNCNAEFSNWEEESEQEES